jgi:hypothetical protein
MLPLYERTMLILLLLNLFLRFGLPLLIFSIIDHCLGVHSSIKILPFCGIDNQLARHAAPCPCIHLLDIGHKDCFERGQ